MLRKLYAVSSFPRYTVTIPAALSLVASLLQGAGLVLIVPFLDALLNNRFYEASKWFAGMVIVFAIYALTQFYAQKACNYSGIRLAGDLFKALSQHLVTLPLSWFEGPRVGAISQIMSKGIIDVMVVPVHLLRPIINAFATPLTVIAFMMYYDYRIGVTALMAAPLLFGAYRLTGYLAARFEHAKNQAAEDVNARIIEFARVQPMLRAYDKNQLGYNLFIAALRKEEETGRRLLTLALPGLLCFAITLQFFFGAVISESVYLVIQGSLSLSGVVALLVLVSRFMEPMNLAADLNTSVRVAENNMHRMVEIFETKPLPEPQTDFFREVRVPADIEVDKVGFSYGHGPVLTDVSFCAAPGTITALVGPSGAGKSTLLRLMARFQDVGQGCIRVGGVDIRDMAFGNLMKHISFVFQQVYLFDGTIADNIRLGDENCTPEDFARAVERAGIREMLDRLPLREQTPVGEGGTALSGGERQRIAIARAILKKSSVLLLDEVTSALDFHNQAAIQETLSLLRPSHTIVVIAHRLETAQQADQIVVLNDHGMVDAIGNHETLLRENGLYAKFWEQREQTLSWQI